MWIPVIYLGGDEHSEGMQANKGCAKEQVGDWGSILLGIFWKTVRNIPGNCPLWRGKEAKVLMFQLLPIPLPTMTEGHPLVVTSQDFQAA